MLLPIQTWTFREPSLHGKACLCGTAYSFNSIAGPTGIKRRYVTPRHRLILMQMAALLRMTDRSFGGSGGPLFCCLCRAPGVEKFARKGCFSSKGYSYPMMISNHNIYTMLFPVLQAKFRRFLQNKGLFPGFSIACKNCW